MAYPSHRRRSRALLAAALTLLSMVPQARGQTGPSARLAYEQSPSTADCPDEAVLRSEVAGRLGYDPFSDAAERTVSARLNRVGSSLTALIELRDAASRVLGRRELASEAHDCSELASAMALAISIAIDPLVMIRAPAPLAPRPIPLAPPVPAPAPRPSEHRARPAVRVSVGVLSSLGAAPAIAAGFTAQVGLRVGLVSLGLEGRADLPAAAAAPSQGTVQSGLLLASLVPCVHYRFMLGCAVGSIGVLQGAGGQVDLPRQDSTLYGAAGIRIGAEVRLYRVLWLRPHLDVLATLTRTTLQINHQDAWTTPRVSGALGLDVLGIF